MQSEVPELSVVCPVSHLATVGGRRRRRGVHSACQEAFVWDY